MPQASQGSGLEKLQDGHSSSILRGREEDSGSIVALEGVGSDTLEASRWPTTWDPDSLLGNTPGVLFLYGMGQPALRHGLWSEMLAEALPTALADQHATQDCGTVSSL